MSSVHRFDLQTTGFRLSGKTLDLSLTERKRNSYCVDNSPDSQEYEYSRRFKANI